MSTPWGEEPPPVVKTRFLYGKATPIDDHTSTALVQAGQLWRSFSDEEEERLQQAWLALPESKRDEARSYQQKKLAAAATAAAKAATSQSQSQSSKPASSSEATNNSSNPSSSSSKPVLTEEEKSKEAHVLCKTIANPDAAPDSLKHHVAVGQDHLFTVDLGRLELYPVFWPGSHVLVQNATWFVPKYEGYDRFQPVQEELASQLETAYRRIGPWHASYSDELASAVTLGAEAEAKLRVELDDIALDVIFQGRDSARIYNRGITSRISKSLLNSFFRGSTTGHSGGQLVLRGWEACQRLKIQSISSGSSKPISRPDTPQGRASGDVTPAPTATRAAAEAAASGLASSLSSSWNRFWPSPKSADPKLPHARNESQGSASSMEQEVKTSGSAGQDASSEPVPPMPSGEPEQPTEAKTEPGEETTEAMEESGPAPRPAQASEHPDEVILAIHGVGQKLADTYEKFSIVNSVNQLRAHMSQHASDPAFRDLVKGRRLQVLPVRWRTQLELDELQAQHSDDSPEEHLSNQFDMRDVEPPGMPSLRRIVSDVSMDIPVYLSHHRHRVVKVVVQEANRVYRLFCQRNPGFNGKVSIVAHSLGAPLAVDILSEQPTWVPPLEEQSKDELHSSTRFCFNTRCLFFVGAPLGLFFVLNKTMLIARRGTSRTKDLPPDIALDRQRWGCLAVDSVYNLYHVLDPVAQLLGPVCDRDWAKTHAQPVAVPTQMTSVLSNWTSSWSKLLANVSIPRPTRFAATAIHPEAAEIVDAVDRQEQAQFDADLQDANNEIKKQQEEAERTKAKVPLTVEEERASARFKALNPSGILDY